MPPRLDSTAGHRPQSTVLSSGVLMRSPEQDLDWIARYLAALPWPMTVRRPPELRTALRQLAANIAAMAERSADDV
jgi:hypothetical protein